MTTLKRRKRKERERGEIKKRMKKSNTERKGRPTNLSKSISYVSIMNNRSKRKNDATSSFTRPP